MSSSTEPEGLLTETQLVIGNYKLDRTIGQGTYGKVRLGIHLTTREKVAVKIIEKAQIQSAKQVARLQREIRFLKLLHHPHIVKVNDVIETNDFIYIIMEYAIGGELFDYIVAHKRVKEKEARYPYVMLENLLLDEKKCIKIIDFGFGNNFSVNGLLDTFCGSPFYAAPEMITGKKYEGPEVDMWSLGVILFALLCGHLPFDDENMKELYAKIRTGSYKAPDYLLPNARHLIKRLITVDPKQRATLEEVLHHPWVNEGYDGPPPNYLPERPLITNHEELSKDIINRLLIFGYKLEEIHASFSPTLDHSKPDAIRSTYFLLSEMVVREQNRLRVEKRKQSVADGMGAASTFSAVKNKAQSAMNLGVSMPIIDENGKSSIDPPPTSSQVEVANRKDYGSVPVITTLETRRASTPDGYNVARQISINALLNRPKVNTKNLPPLPVKSQESPLEMSSLRISGHVKDGSAPDPRVIAQVPSPKKDGIARRQSVPVNMLSDSPQTTRRLSTASRLKEDLKAVSTWLLSVSTTTSKHPDDILNQLLKILKETKSEWHKEGSYTIQCEVDISTFLPSKQEVQDSPAETTSTISGTTGTETSRESEGRYSVPHPPMDSKSEKSEVLEIGSTPTTTISPQLPTVSTDPKFFGFRSKSGAVSFQVDIVKVQKMNLYGLHFKRISGGVWNYKKVCNRLLSQLVL